MEPAMKILSLMYCSFILLMMPDMKGDGIGELGNTVGNDDRERKANIERGCNKTLDDLYKSELNNERTSVAGS